MWRERAQVFKCLMRDLVDNKEGQAPEVLNHTARSPDAREE